MTRALLLALACFTQTLVPTLTPAPASAAASTPGQLLRDGHVRVRVRTEPAHQVMIGQQTRLLVEILTDSWFTKAPSYPELNLEGAIALMPEQLGTNFTERVDGVTYAAQRRSYVIFPQRTGPLEIPSLRIRLGVSQDGAPGEPFVLHTRPLRIQVVLPAEAEGIVGLVTTPWLTLREQWSRSLDGLVVGDAVRRTVRMEADRALGMLLPDLEFEAPAGIAVYADQARSQDHINRGQYRGERVESVTYVLQRPGEFILPAIELYWWNLSSGALESETLAARSFEVGGDIAALSALVPPDPLARWRERFDSLMAYAREHRVALLLAMLGLIGAGLLLRRVLPEVVARWQAWRLRRRKSEPWRFRQLQRSAGRGDADALVRDYWCWRDGLVSEMPSLSHAAVQRLAETSGFAADWTEFEHRRYGGAAASPAATHLGSGLRAFRKALLAAGRPQASRAPARLNPSTSPACRTWR